MEYHNAVFRKPGAVFSSAEEAFADKNRFYPPELVEQAKTMFTNMLDKGVLLEPITYTWDPATQTLTVIKKVSSKADYRNNVTIPTLVFKQYHDQAGWIGLDAGWGPNGEESPAPPIQTADQAQALIEQAQSQS